ncbi:MAG: DUF3306 domain-containing protein [Gammaproteobacteria bacterium]|jgi:hypothetical protein|nr:DUF3306 domain-containing protein [Gammaproteobacteria bacterium]
MTRENKESVLSRWSRRKLEAEKEVRPADLTLPSEIEAEPSAPAAETETGPLLTDADMPDIESLDEGSDFSGFMSEGVSDELRNLALRKLFRAPVFNIRDGLDEYDEDYTSFEKLGDIVTCDMKHRIEMQEQKLREKLAAETEAAEAEKDALETTDGEDEMDALEAIDDADETEQSAAAVATADPEAGADEAVDDEQS